MFDQKQRGDHDVDLDEELDEQLEIPPTAVGKRSRMLGRYGERQSLTPGRLRALMARAMAGAGAPLPAALRARFERSLGVDLGSVRVHRGSAAASAADAIDAVAFAHRGEVFLGGDAGELDSPAGTQLLAHEVAHAVQQRGAAAASGPLELSTPGGALERDADSAAAAMLAGRSASVAPGGAAVVARQERAPRGGGGSGDGARGEGTGPAANLSRDMVNVDEFQHQFTQRTEVYPQPDDMIRVDGGTAQFNARLSLRSGVRVGDGEAIEIGPIQELVAVRREAIYRRRDGTTVAEYHGTVSRGRDAPGEHDGRPVPAPWYWQPSRLDDAHRSGAVRFEDSPRWDVPRNMSGGTLVETRGEDRFRTSVAAKQGDTILHLRNIEWTVPWTTAVQSDGNATGDELEGSETDRAPSTSGPATTAESRQREWVRFRDVAAARAAGWRTLLNYIDDARTQNPAAHTTMVQALRELNPRFTATITCNQEYASIGSDTVALTATGHTAVSRTFTGLTQGASRSMSFNLIEVFDPARLGWADAIAFTARISGAIQSIDANLSWHCPFNTQGGNMNTSDPDYASAYRLRGSADAGGGGEASGSESTGVRRHASGEPIQGDARQRLAAARGGQGQPLPPWLRQQFGRSLGADLAGVRVHTDGAAAAAAHALGARAFAQGQDIYFADGNYAPESADGQRLLAHEVAHTVQSGPAAGEPAVTSPGDAVERDADAAADTIMAGGTAQVAGATAGTIGRDGNRRKVSGLSADMFTVGEIKPNIAGTVTAQPAGDQVSINGSVVTFSADVSLAADVEVDDIFQVGPTQTLVSSSRHGLYRRDGKADGEIVAQYNSQTSDARDAMQDRKNPNKSHYVAPWYSNPDNIGKTGDSEKRTASVSSFYDQPGFDIPARMGGGLLTHTTGGDNFATSVTAVRNGAQLNLKSFTWSQNWAMTIADNQRGVGAEALSAPGGPGASKMDGPTSFEKAEDWYHFATVDAAKAAGWRMLLDHLGVAKAKDPTSFNNMVEALRQLNPVFSVTVKVVKGAETFSDDDIELTATGSKTLVRGMGTFANGASGTTTFNLCDVFDPASLGPGSKLQFSVRDVGWVANAPSSLPYNFPFNPVDELQNMNGSAAKYQIKARLGG